MFYMKNEIKSSSVVLIQLYLFNLLFLLDS